MQAVKCMEVNCWEVVVKETEKEIWIEKFSGCKESRYYLGKCVWGNRWWKDGVENCSSQEIQSSLIWPWCVISVWTEQVKSLYFISHWTLAFTSELFKWSFLANCHKTAMGLTRRATILPIIQCRAYLSVDAPLEWNKDYYYSTSQ